MKKIIALVLAAALSLSLVACSSGEETTATTGEPVTVRLLAASASEFEANIVADQLRKAGYVVEMNLTPDLSTRIAVAEAGEYDLVFGGWQTGNGSPDYAVRNLYRSNGSSNSSGLADPKVDELIDLGASQTAEEYVATYTELEKYMVEEMAYIVPLYSTMKLHAYHDNVIAEESVIIPRSSTTLWKNYEYVNAEDTATRPLVYALINSAVMTHLDPVQVNDVTPGGTLANTYIRLINLDEEDQVTVDNSLSLSYAISEDNMNYYFLLRDDINFGATENGVAVDTGVMVAAEDVVFSLDRARDQNSVPSNKVYTQFTYIDSVEIVTDMAELTDTLESTTGESVYDTLAAGAQSDVTTLAAARADVDNAAGSYQVVKVTATEAFPQMLNSITSASAGIVSKDQVTAINTFEVADFDITSDVAYGDFNAIKNGENHLWNSGQYVMVSVDDYTSEYQANPGYKGGTEDYIQNVTHKFFKDKDSALSSFRSFEVDYLADVDQSKYELLLEEENTIIEKVSSTSVSMCTFNVREGAPFSDQNLRLSVLYAMDPNAFIAAKNNLVESAYSTLSPLIGNPNSYTADAELSAQYLQAYYDSLA